MAVEHDHVIVGIHVSNRVANAPRIQELLTEYGCEISTRLGLHGASDGSCSPRGVIILELMGDPARGRELCAKLEAIDGLDVQRMVFPHL